jgi:hypothetical protein
MRVHVDYACVLRVSFVCVFCLCVSERKLEEAVET